MYMRTNKLVCGVGVNDYDGPVTENGKPIKAYDTWHSMLRRCYCIKALGRNPTYIGCSVCEEWLSFSNFKTWYDENYKDGFHLDKDILVEGNKIYSSDTCRFVPQYLNKLLTDSGNARGNLPTGVVEQKLNLENKRLNSTYLVRCSDGYETRLNKTFKTIQEAVAWYSATKKRIVREQAVRAFLENAIKTDIYLALVRREW